MALKEIKVLSSTKSGFRTIVSEAETWGQLKDNLREFGNVNELTAVVKETKNTLEDDGASLPAGDFTLYLSPKKIKAGTINN